MAAKTSNSSKYVEQHHDNETRWKDFSAEAFFEFGGAGRGGDVDCALHQGRSQHASWVVLWQCHCGLDGRAGHRGDDQVSLRKGIEGEQADEGEIHARNG